MANTRKSGSNSDIDLLIRLLKLGSLVNTPMKEGVCDPAGISATELKIVMALAGEGELAGHDLVEIMGMPPMSVSRAIASLRARDWVENAGDPGNRRRRPVRLTRLGRAGYRRMQRDIAQVAEALVGSLDKAQRAAFGDAADAVIANMAGWIESHHGAFRMRR